MDSTASSRMVTDLPNGQPDRWRWFALIVLLLADFMDLLDTTVVNVAIPSIQRHLAISYRAVQWVVAGYSLAFALVLITGGRLGDIVGRRRMFLIGVAGFTVAAALSGAAQTPGRLVAARILQGAMAAVMVPQVLSIIQATFDARERGAAFGVAGAVSGLAAIAGPLLGGVLVSQDVWGLGWRTVFLINIPVGLFVLVAARLLLRESRSDRAPRLDLVGVVLVTVSMLLLVYPLIEGRQAGWPAWTFVMLAASAPAFALFALYERTVNRRGDAPLVVPELFRLPAFIGGLVVQLTHYAGVGALFIVYTLYVQQALGFSALHAGPTMMPFSLGAMAAAGASVQLAPRFGRRVVIAGALLTTLGAAATLWAALGAGAALTTWDLALPFVLAGVGMGLILPPLVDGTLAGVPVAHAGSASGVLNAMAQIG